MTLFKVLYGKPPLVLVTFELERTLPNELVDIEFRETDKVLKELKKNL